MAEVNLIKETFLLGSLSVALPTVDVYTDIALTSKLYHHGHNIWATLLLLPLLVNYLLCWFTWIATEKQKRFTWVAALLGCYHQLVALRVIWIFWKEPKKGMREKKHLERNLMEHEIFTEAVPSALIMTFLILVAVFVEVKLKKTRGKRFILFLICRKMT